MLKTDEGKLRYQLHYGLKPTGPHCRLAGELSHAVIRVCSRCDSNGVLEWDDTASWRICPACQGFGWFPLPNGPEIKAIRAQVAQRYPDAVVAGADDVGPKSLRKVLENGSVIIENLQTGAMLSAFPVRSRAVKTSRAITSVLSRLWRAYETTVFCATVDGRDIRIKPGETHPCLDQALAARGETTWAYITAWNPGSRELSRHENDARHERLKNDVARLGLQMFEGQGAPANAGWVAEESLLVLGISLREALQIGLRYGQNAIVVGEAGCEAKLLKCHVHT